MDGGEERGPGGHPGRWEGDVATRNAAPIPALSTAPLVAIASSFALDDKDGSRIGRGGRFRRKLT